MRAILIVVATMVGASSALAQAQQPRSLGDLFEDMGNNLVPHHPAVDAERNFERSVADYRQCIAANQNNVNACEGLRHIMDASAQAAGRYSGSR